MNTPLDNPRFPRLTGLELGLCERFNHTCRWRGIGPLFAAVSRLGDGMFWYGLMLALLLAQGAAAGPAVARMLAAGGLCLLVYKWLKSRTGRPRPCDRTARIRTLVAPLDQYSFPSGHTLHAVSFSLVAVVHYPALAWLLLPFTALVALSRLVLGLHYPSDVLAGAALGAGLAGLVLQV